MSNFSDTSNSGSGFFQGNDLSKRIFYTLFILVIYRFCTYVPIPGIDPDSLKNLISGNERSLLGMFNVFAGGAVNVWQSYLGHNALHICFHYYSIVNWCYRIF